MKEIQLTQGKVALIDDNDFELVGKHTWAAEKSNETFYAISKIRIGGKSVNVRLHRFLMSAEPNMLVDHRDRNGLNNQRENLRVCTSQQNNANRTARGVSTYKGVCYTEIKRVNQSGIVKVYPYWQASIQIDGKSKILGRFKNEQQAALAYNKAAVAKYGEFANLNVITPVVIAEYDKEMGAVIVK